MKEIIEFFDSRAERWDGYLKQEEIPIIQAILKRAGVHFSDTILDVGCGTGVLVPFLLEHKIPFCNITGIDIAPKMIEILSRKYPELSVINRNFEEEIFKEESFDKVIIFNTFPHFLQPSIVFKRAYPILKKSGKIIIAHTMNRAKLDEHHRHSKGVVQSHLLISDVEFKNNFQQAGFYRHTIDDSDYFYAEGYKFE